MRLIDGPTPRFARPRAAGRRSVAALLGAAVALASITVAGSPAPAGAHAPHDQVSDIDFPVDYAESGWVLAIVRGRLMRSPDRGVTWDEIVRGFGGEAQKIREVAISPVDPSVVYAVSRAGEVLRSNDTGLSWEPLSAPDGMRPNGVAVSATDTDMAIVLGVEPTSAARTDDGGTTWTPVEFAGAPLAAVAAVDDPASGRMYVSDSQGRVFGSGDSGATLEQLSRLPQSSARELAVTADGAVLFAASGDDRLYRSDDGGASWEQIGDGLPEEQTLSISPSPTFADDETVWVSTRLSGPHRSLDGGRTFEPIARGLSRSVQADDVDAPHFTSVATAPDESGIVLLGGFDGLFLLAPGTEGWASVETLTGYIAGLDLSPNFADDQTIAVMTYVRGGFVSVDGGATWMASNDGLLVDGINEGNRFAPIRRMHNVHFSPTFTDDAMLWSATWVRVVRSTDGGASWDEIPVGTPPEGSPLRQFVLAPSPTFARDNTVYVATRQGEFFASGDAGARDSWDLLHTFDTRVRSIAPSPVVADDGTIFVGTTSSVFRSVDGGHSWDEMPVGNIAEVTGRETDVGVKVAVSPDFATDGTVYAATDSGLWRTTDAGETWVEVVDGPLTGDELIEAVAFSPDYASDGLALVSARGVGLVRTTDHGESYAFSGESLDQLNLLIADYANPTSSAIQFSPTYASDGTIFAFAQQELVRSLDAGATWEIVPLPSDNDVIATLPPFEPAGDDSTAPPLDTTPLPTVPDAADDGGADAAGDGDDGTISEDDDGVLVPGSGADDDGSNVWILWSLLGIAVVIVVIVLVRTTAPDSTSDEDVGGED